MMQGGNKTKCQELKKQKGEPRERKKNANSDTSPLFCLFVIPRPVFFFTLLCFLLMNIIKEIIRANFIGHK